MTTVSEEPEQMRNLYQEIITYEYNKYKEKGSLAETFFTLEELRSALKKFDEKVFKNL